MTCFCEKRCHSIAVAELNPFHDLVHADNFASVVIKESENVISIDILTGSWLVQ